jgi:hypothetical protein
LESNGLIEVRWTLTSLWRFGGVPMTWSVGAADARCCGPRRRCVAAAQCVHAGRTDPCAQSPLVPIL